MDSGVILDALRFIEPELKAAGIVHLRLFGSTARGERNAQSDVDLMADIDRSKHLTLVGLIRIENRLSDLLGTKVDLSLADSLRETVREKAVREAVIAF
jgi:uncharacterized protein